MNYKALKYLAVFTIPLAGYIALSFNGIWTYAALMYAFFIVPSLELILPASEENMDKAEESVAKQDRIFDYLLYCIVPIQWSLLVLFLYSIQEPLTTFELIGRTLSFGVACGVFGINVAHELGHRRTKYERTMAKALLMTSLYMHFIIEHNLGHHKNVSTENDPASADRGEWLYTFWIKSVVLSYISAWKLEGERLERKKQGFWSIHNEMIWFTVLQTALVLGIFAIFGIKTMLLFILAATIGFLLLETVNYIEHYGLRRKKKEGKNYYEKVKPVHSWNSNHAMGRILLFELTRHSDHHANAGRKYQVLRHFDESPQMPTGYPGMMILSFFPPLFFKVMHPIIDQYKAKHPDALA